MIKHQYTLGEYFAGFIIAIALIITCYRVAVIFDWVPKDFQPNQIAYREYVDFKKYLSTHTMEPGFSGSASTFLLKRFKTVEDYLAKKERAAADYENVAKKCNENDIFRFFMFMGDEDSNKCSEHDVGIKSILKDANGKGVKQQQKLQQQQLQEQNLQQQPIQQQNSDQLSPEMMQQMQQEQQPAATVPAQ